MKISYLVTCSTEKETLSNLLSVLGTLINNSDDELVILIDKTTRSQDVIDITSELASKLSYNIVEKRNLKIYESPLNNDYGTHKNFGNSKCTGDWIFQIDGDELPPESLLGDNLKSIIESNPDVELIWVPRINDFKGVTKEHAEEWGWKLEPSPFLNGKPKSAWPDWQGRIYKNVPDHIKWQNRLHETISGHTQYSFLPAEEEYALYHDKTIETQIATNLRYNRDFSQQENKGISDKKQWKQ